MADIRVKLKLDDLDIGLDDFDAVALHIARKFRADIESAALADMRASDSYKSAEFLRNQIAAMKAERAELKAELKAIRAEIRFQHPTAD